MNTPRTASFDAHIDTPPVDPISQTFRRTVLLSILVLVLTALVLYWVNRRRHALRHGGKCLLLCGIPQSGKTLLFNRLTSDADRRTTSRASVNHGTMTLDYLASNRPVEKVRVIEVPCVSRQRHYSFQAYRTSTKAMIFVIDSSTIEKDVRQVGDYLFHILRDKHFREQRLPLLIFCNKQDLDQADHNLPTIRQLLERELTYRRRDHNVEDAIGRPGKETFEFSDVKDLRVEFVEGFALDTRRRTLDRLSETGDESESGPHLLKVHQWIARVWFE